MENKNLRNSVLGSFFWKFCERFLNQGISFVISLVLARILAPEDYGVIALVMVFLNLSSVFINSGFSTALVQKKDADETDYSTIFYCSLACALLIYVVLFFAAPLVAAFYSIPSLTAILRVFALSVPLSVVPSVQGAYVSKNLLFRKVFLVSAISSISSGIVGVLLAFAGFGVWALVFQSLTATVTLTVANLFLIPWRPKLLFSKSSAKEMMRFGSRVLAADLSGTFFSEVRSLIIGRVYTSADLAYYNKGNQMPQLLTINLSAALVSVMFPAIANHCEDMHQVKMMTKRSFRLLGYIMFPCMAGLSAVMEPLILFLITEKWAQSIPFGQILSMSCFIKLVSDITIQVLKAIGRSDVVLGLEVKKKPVYILLLIVGVKISVMGLALAMLVYDVYALIVNMYQLHKYISYSLWEQFRDMLPALLLGTVMAVLVLLIPTFNSLVLTLIVKVLAGVGIYLAGSALFRLETFGYLKNLLLERVKHKRGKE